MGVVPSTVKSSASPFAHLAGARAPGRPAAAEDDKKDDKDKNATAEGDEDETEMAEDDEDSGEDGSDDKKKGKKAKKAKAADDEEDPDAEGDGDDRSDKEDEKDAKAAGARGRERGRIKAILLSEPGKANPAAAAHLATGTSMSRKQAVQMLAAMQAGAPAAAAPPRDALRDRMTHEPNPTVGAGDAQGAPNLAAAIVQAGKKRRGEV